MLRAADLLARTDDCALALRADGVVAGWNAAAERLFGYHAGEAVGHPCHQVLDCRDPLGPGAPGEDCPLVQAARADRLGPAVDLLARHRTGRAVEASGSVILLPPAFDARALVLLRPTVFDVGGTPVDEPTGHTDLARSLDRLLVATGADAAELFLVAPGGQQLVLAAHRGRAPRAFREILRFERGQGFPGLVATTGEAIATADLGRDDRFLRAGVKRQGFQTCIGVPVTGHGEVLGSLQVAFRRPAVSTGPVLLLLERAAARLATAVELDRLRAMDGMTRQILARGVGAPAGPYQVASQALDTLLDATGVERGALLLADGAADVLQVASDHALPTPLRHLLARGQPIATCPALVRQTCMLPSDRAAARIPCCETVRRHLSAALCVPLQAQGQSLGVALLGCSGPEPLPTRRLAFLQATLDHTALMVRDARLTLREEHPIAAGVSRPVPADSSGHSFLDVHVLGPLAILRNGLPVPPERFARSRSLTLLKILLTRYGKPVHREELTELLWPDGDPRSSGDLLHVVVHYLRRALEPHPPEDRPSSFIVSRGDAYLFDPDAPHTIDSQEFLAALRQSEQHEHLGRPDLALNACRQAIGLYAGDLLEDEPYSDWCALEREYLRESLLGVLRRAARLETARGGFDAAASFYRHALRIEPTLEESHRGLMEVLRRAGRVAEALRQYQECRAILRRELGVAPMPETESLRQELVSAAQPISADWPS